MKKTIFNYMLAAIVFSSFALGCSSQKNASSSDTTMKDTSKVSAPPPITDTVKKDTVKTTDTAKKPQ